MKRLTTNAKIKFLQQYVQKWHKRWQKKHPGNIVGFRIGKKVTEGKLCRNYSIIFQVAKKIKSDKLDQTHVIPKSFKIKFPDKKTRVIYTDVHATGLFKFQNGITGQVKSIYSQGTGSAGLFVSDDDNRTYVVTNYHVVAEEMMANGQYYYRRPASQLDNDVTVIRRSPLPRINGRFEIGRFSRQIDAAFVDIHMAPNNTMNTLPDHRRVQGRVSVQPIPPSYQNKEVIVYCRSNPRGIGTRINDNSSIFYTTDPDIYFEDVIQMIRVTKAGDSGSLVVMPNLAVLAIIIGADDLYSYAVPFYKISAFKNVYVI